MRIKFAGLLSAALLVTLAAQDHPPQPPGLLRIYREKIKEGHETAHEAVETKEAEALRKAKYPWGVIGMEAVTGLNEVWFVQPFESFADFQKGWDAFWQSAALKAAIEPLDRQDGEHRVLGRTLLAEYRPEMSYHPADFVKSLPRMHLVHVIIIRVKPGYDGAVHEVARLGVGALEKADDPRPLLTYHVVSGDSNTYLLFRASVDWTPLDNENAQLRAIFAAMGGDAQKYVGLVREAVSEEETMIFYVNPEMSAVSKEFAAGDPAFWTPKPKAAPKKPAAEKKEKPAASK
jgi:hypothetical protein